MVGITNRPSRITWLAAMHLVKARRDGKEVYYSVDDPVVPCFSKE
jgi:DNA-binding transcriptional ArsR family regulator